jgi:CHASE3 domain sensor protein
VWKCRHAEPLIIVSALNAFSTLRIAVIIFCAALILGVLGTRLVKWAPIGPRHDQHW